MKKILIIWIILVFWTTNIYASNFVNIKKDFVDYFDHATANSLQQKISNISQNNLKSIKSTLEIDYLPRIGSGKYSHKFETAIEYIYFKIQDTYVDPNETDLEVIGEKRNLVQKVSNNDVNIYFFTQIDRWMEETTACGWPYDGSHTCYIYVEINNNVSYLWKMTYSIWKTTDMVLNNDIISFDSWFGDGASSWEFDISLNVYTGEIEVFATIKKAVHEEHEDIEITETTTKSILEK